MYWNKIEGLTFKLQGWHFNAFLHACSHGSVGRWRVGMRRWCHHLIMACKGKKRNCYLWQCRTHPYKMHLLVILDKDMEILFGWNSWKTLGNSWKISKYMARFHTYFQWCHIRSFPLSACYRVFLQPSFVHSADHETNGKASSRNWSFPSAPLQQSPKVLHLPVLMSWETPKCHQNTLWTEWQDRVENSLCRESTHLVWTLMQRKYYCLEVPKLPCKTSEELDLFGKILFFLSFGFWGVVVVLWRFWIIKYCRVNAW